MSRRNSDWFDNFKGRRHLRGNNIIFGDFALEMVKTHDGLSMQVTRGNKIMLSLGMFNVEIVQVGVGDDADTGLPEEDLEVDIHTGLSQGCIFS